MLNQRNGYSRGTVIRPLIVWCILLVGIVHAQRQQNQPDDLTTAIAEVKGGNWAFVNQIALAGPTRATPILRDLFESSQDVDTKDRIALVLYKFGYRDGLYWDYIAKQASAVVESDVPFRFGYNSQGKMVGQSDEFIAWAKAHNISPDAAYENTLMELTRVYTLGRVHTI
jgi:hypothetical protein